MRRASIATDGRVIRLHLWADLPRGRLAWTVCEVRRIAGELAGSVIFAREKYQRLDVDTVRVWAYRAELHCRDPEPVADGLRWMLQSRGYRVKE